MDPSEINIEDPKKLNSNKQGEMDRNSQPILPNSPLKTSQGNNYICFHTSCKRIAPVLKLNDHLVDSDLEAFGFGNSNEDDIYDAYDKNIDNCFNKIGEMKSSSKKIELLTSTSSHKSVGNKGKLLYDTNRERKAFEEKIACINNRIKKLQEKEKEISKKIELSQANAEKYDYLKIKKLENKKYVKNTKTINEQLFAEKKLKIKKESAKRKENLQKALDVIYQKNCQAFRNARTDKLIFDSMLTQSNSHFSNINNFRCTKIKQKPVQFKAEKIKNFKKIEIENKSTNDLGNKTKELEKIEERCAKKLTTTSSKKNSKRIVYNFSMTDISVKKALEFERIPKMEKNKNKSKDRLSSHKKKKITKKKAVKSELKLKK